MFNSKKLGKAIAPFLTFIKLLKTFYSMTWKDRKEIYIQELFGFLSKLLKSILVESTILYENSKSSKYKYCRCFSSIWSLQGELLEISV